MEKENMRKLERTKNSLRNFGWGVINKGISLLLPFFIRIFIVNILGKEYLGLNNLFTSILNVLSLAELGIGSAMVYSMYQPIANGDTVKICSLQALYKKLYQIIGIIIFILGIALLPFLKYLIKGGVDGINIRILYLIFLSDTVLSYFLFAYKNSLLMAHQRTDISSNIGSIIHLLLNLTQVILLITVKNYYVYILMKPLFTVVNNLVINAVTKRMYPQYEPYGTISERQKQDILKKIKALFGHKIGTTIITSADSLVISTFLGIGILAIYSNYYYILYFIVSIMGLLFNGMLGGIGNSLITESTEKNYSLFLNINFITIWFVIWCSTCLLCLFQPFMKLWMGESMLLPTSSLIFIVIYYYTWQFRCAGMYFKDAAGMWQADFWKPYIAAIVNLIVNIYLVKRIGINGVFISTIFCMLFINFPWETKVLFRDLFKCRCTNYIIKQVVYSLEAILICTLCYTVCEKIPIIGIGNILIRFVFCLVIPNALFLIGNCKTKEFCFVVDKTSAILRGIKKHEKRC